jgi:hypothetical protein
VGPYQYWTCADMGKLRSVVSELETIKVSDIYGKARALYHCFLT